MYIYVVKHTSAVGSIVGATVGLAVGELTVEIEGHVGKVGTVGVVGVVTTLDGGVNVGHVGKVGTPTHVGIVITTELDVGASVGLEHNIFESTSRLNKYYDLHRDAKVTL
jgi:hypothetical protein